MNLDVKRRELAVYYRRLHSEQTAARDVKRIRMRDWRAYKREFFSTSCYRCFPRDHSCMCESPVK